MRQRVSGDMQEQGAWRLATGTLAWEKRGEEKVGGKAPDPFRVRVGATELGQRATATHQPNEEQHDGDDQQQMDEGTDGVSPYYSEQPCDQ